MMLNELLQSSGLNFHEEYDMSKSDDTLNKAFGHIPKELPGKDIWDWLPSSRDFKFYYLKIVRYFTR